MIVNMHQNTAEWLEWRKTKIGASDLPIIMGVSPYGTPFELWKRKLGFAKQDDTYAMAYGRSTESTVRELVMQQTGHKYQPAVYQSDEYEWAIASLDGVCDDPFHLLEIKCCNADDHKLAKMNRVPEKYWPQLQWQMWVTGADVCLYASYHQGELVTFNVDFDEFYVPKMLFAAQHFKTCLDNYQPPAITSDDYVPIRVDDVEVTRAIQLWIQAKSVLDAAKKHEEQCKKIMQTLTPEQNWEGLGVRMTKYERSTTDWSSVKSHYQITDESLESFKKTSTCYRYTTTTGISDE